MELKDLDQDERVALVALIELMVRSNNRASDEEAVRVARDAAELGPEAYRAAVEELDRRFPDESDLRGFLTTIARQEARELIYATALDAALADTPDAGEAKLLDWLAGVWQITTRLEPPQ